MLRAATVPTLFVCLTLASCVARTSAAGDPAAGEAPRITIDATETGEPISKYIYGQFIEHLGRCIYGGIWAEMLEDRKFFYPVTADYNPYEENRRIPADSPYQVVGASPWEIIGPADSVTMVEEDSFVGDHTPRIASGSGIRQRDLGLLKSKDYVGYIWWKPAAGATEVDVTLRWGEWADEQTTAKVTPKVANNTGEYRKSEFRLTAGADTDHGALEIRVSGGPCLVGTVSLMPADNIDGMRADTIALLKQLDAPTYRWPGGDFVSGYNWEDGIGPRDRRPPRANPAWTGIEHNDFGLHEFIRFCRVVGAEPEVVVNAAIGSVESAVEEVQYANGAADTRAGKRRAANGSPEPFKITWWTVGNEMYDYRQLGNVPLVDYVKRHNAFADAMRGADPSIRLAAVGAVGNWDETMLTDCADRMDLISEHFYVEERPGNLLAHIRLVPAQIARISNAHRQYREKIDGLAGKDVRVSIDEWNYWYGPHVFGEMGTRCSLKDALGIAAGIHEFSRQSDMVFMANCCQAVNVFGCVKTSKTAACLDSTGMVLKLYRLHFGGVPVEVTASQPFDVAAAWTEDRKALSIGVVNPTMEKQDFALSLSGAKLTGSGKRLQIAGDDPLAYNDPGKEPNVKIEEAMVSNVSDTLSVAPCSATIFVLPVE